jgi:Tol biopolymer transport system component
MFRSGGRTRDRARLVWIDREGRVVGDAGPENVYSSLRIAPDGQRVAIGVRDASGVDDQWLLDVTRRTMTRFTFDRRRETWPVWSPDGRQIAFGSNRSGIYQLYRKDARGGNAEQAIASSGAAKVPSDWSPDGRYLLYSDNDLNDADDISAWPLSGDPKPIPVVSTPFNEQSGQFSPDGKWIAYQSNESGRFEIYVQAFPASGGKWQVSTAGGRSPRWRADGKELFYFTPTEDSQMVMAVDVGLGNGNVELGAPHRLFSTSMPTGNSYPYDVARDGQRFLVQQLLPESAAPPLTVILNWPALLKK